MTPRLTDRAALARNRARATDPGLHAMAATEAQERLTEVNRTFTSALVVTPCPQAWGGFATIPDDPALALTPDTHDLIIHAMCLHWADDPVGQLIQCRRALVPDGLLLAILPGGQTLTELRQALGHAEVQVTGGLSPRVVPMADIRDAGAILQRAGLALPVADSFTRSLHYRDMGHLMADLHAAGEQNALADRLRRPTRRAVLARAAQIYADSFPAPDGRVTATVEIVTLTGWAPAEGQQKPLRPGSAAQRLADALQTGERPLPKG
jgi:SAM-dependent methyltransferase